MDRDSSLSRGRRLSRTPAESLPHCPFWTLKECTMHSTNGVTVSPMSAPASSTSASSTTNVAQVSAAPTGKAQPMKVTPYFCPIDADPFETVEWEKRTAAIKDENGKALF